MIKRLLFVFLILKSVILYSTASYSLSLTELISELFKNDSSIKSAESTVKESSNDIKTAWAAYLPEFDAKIIKGDELKNKYNAANDQYYYEELDFTLKQKIWDFGETFYFTELAAYIHNQLTPYIATVLIVPKGTNQNFGSLFEIQSNSDEVFISDAKVEDVDIIDAVTASKIRASGTIVTS